MMLLLMLLLFVLFWTSPTQGNPTPWRAPIEGTDETRKSRGRDSRTPMRYMLVPYSQDSTSTGSTRIAVLLLYESAQSVSKQQ